MSETSAARPAQVTVAGWVVVVASVVVVVSVFDQLGRIGSVESRESVERFLAEPPGAGLGLGVDAVLDLLRASAYVAAACGAASAILGWYVLRRDRVARLALTVLAVPLFLTGLASGGFFPAVVAGSSLLLWAQPARDWFAGRTPRTTETRDPVRTPQPPAPPSSGPSSAGPDAAPSARRDAASTVVPGVVTGQQDQPAPTSGWGAPAERPTPPGPWKPGDSRTVLLTGRPEPILWSCLLTWAFSGIAVIGLVLSAVLLIGDGASVVAEARDQAPSVAQVDISDQALLAGVLVVVLGLLVWAVAAIVLAVLVWRGRDWARITLAVSAGLAAAISLLTLLGGQVYAVPLVVGCVVATRMLLSRRAAEWCRSSVRR